jgi:FkbM family methyltransferase
MSIDVNGFEVFLTTNPLRINAARMEHLASLKLAIAGKRVLEVGAGIGLLTGFFEELGCSVLTTDGRSDNVAEIRRKYPHRQAEVLDLETTDDITYLGEFDIIFCYGTLYHLANPEQAIKTLAAVCREMILLETCVTPGHELEIYPLDEDKDNPNQSVSGTGCRPTRPWVVEALKKYFEFVYLTTHQPAHLDFDLQWEPRLEKKLHRAVFVGARQPLSNEKLTETIATHQTYDPSSYQVWKDQLYTMPNLDQYIHELGSELLIYLAEKVAAYEPLELVPGWHFDSGWNSQQITVQLRRMIWDEIKQRSLEPRISFAWYDDLKIFLHLGNDVSSQLFVEGRYDPNEFYFLNQLLSSGMTVIDLGANEGLYTLFAAKHVGDSGIILSFEPSLREFQRLQDNLALNPEMTNIQTFQIALSNTSGSQLLKIAADDHSGQNTLGDFAYEGIACLNTETVTVRRLDDVLEELAVEAVDVIKIDVEGSEHRVFEGARKTLERDRPLILFELVDQALQKQGSSTHELLSYLRDLGYEIFSWGEFTGLPIKTIRESLPDGNLIAAHPSKSWNLLGEIEQVHLTQVELGKMQASLEQTRNKLQIAQQVTQQEIASLKNQISQLQNDFQNELQFIKDRFQETRVELQKNRGELQKNKEVKEQIQATLESQKNQIAAMQSSKFWQLRNQWIAFKKRFGLPE